MELLTREQELDVRRRQHEERLREQEELEKRVTTTCTNYSHPPPTRPLPPLAPILKKTTLPSRASTLPRVAFSSPIRSVNFI